MTPTLPAGPDGNPRRALRTAGGWLLGLPATDVDVFSTESAAAALPAVLLLSLGAQLLGVLLATVHYRRGRRAG
ncbi:hypothetical protein ACFYE2_09825 [Kocuria sp. CPCC 205300]|uniref:hypothetical protein n=1 Tax=Kocuria sabuli TaxID=3071448 RepID=UPI0036DD83E4